MENMSAIGVSTPRKEAWDKVTGGAKYNDDIAIRGILHAKMLTSPHAHARIQAIDISRALEVSGVQAVITGEYTPALSGSVIMDMPPIAKDKIRY